MFVYSISTTFMSSPCCFCAKIGSKSTPSSLGLLCPPLKVPTGPYLLAIPLSSGFTRISREYRRTNCGLSLLEWSCACLGWITMSSTGSPPLKRANSCIFI